MSEESREVIRNLPNHELVNSLKALAFDFERGMVFLYSSGLIQVVVMTLEEIAKRLESPSVGDVDDDTTVTTGD